jgi:curved DNA-binding protein CbpA
LNAIKKAYRKLVVVAHPNKGGDEEKFKEIQKAYEVLIDPEARKEYNKQLQLITTEKVKEQNAKNRKLLTQLNKERNKLNQNTIAISSMNDKVPSNANRKLFNDVLKKNIRNKAQHNALLRNIEKGKNLRPTPPKNIINKGNNKVASLKQNALLPVEENSLKIGGRRMKTARRKEMNLRKTQKKRGSSIKRKHNK